MTCTSGCKTQDHASWGECLRAKNIHTNALTLTDLDWQRRADKDLDAYAAARKQGIQPNSTRRAHVDAAIKHSDQTGKAYEAS